MRQATHMLSIATRGRGLVEVTDEVVAWTGAVQDHVAGSASGYSGSRWRQDC